ncbi:hypothetical protein [Nocardiopsis sp. CNT312]|uniref:hypothetical protein n=1 Tax=Nocardiopsis sp. CNT312 TaxID=1137268 RepID=UPI0012DF3D28|nr:hypothetical protein [Nocardiopsis sp. CNT312]
MSPSRSTVRRFLTGVVLSVALCVLGAAPAPAFDDGSAAVPWHGESAVRAAAEESPEPVPRQEGADERGHRLSLAGGSLPLLAAAATVAVGGGAAAVFLGRKRTTALDYRIED